MKQTAEQMMEQAERWITNNPEMYEAFVQAAKDAKIGWSARGIAEMLRWNPKYQKEDGSVFKIPNSITPALGRIVAARHPETADTFIFAHSKVDTIG